jgi:hypothetical protein
MCSTDVLQLLASRVTRPAIKAVISVVTAATHQHHHHQQQHHVFVYTYMCIDAENIVLSIQRKNSPFAAVGGTVLGCFSVTTRQPTGMHGLPLGEWCGVLSHLPRSSLLTPV